MGISIPQPQGTEFCQEPHEPGKGLRTLEINIAPSILYNHFNWFTKYSCLNSTPITNNRLNPLRIEGKCLHLIKSTYQQITANTILNGEMLESGLGKSVLSTIGLIQPFAEGPS